MGSLPVLLLLLSLISEIKSDNYPKCFQYFSIILTAYVELIQKKSRRFRRDFSKKKESY